MTDYRTLIGQINGVAGALAARGVGIGDVVGLLAPNIPAFAAVFHGILRAGATATTINALYTAEDIAKQLQDSHAKILVTVSPLLPHAKEAAAKIGIPDELLIVLDGAEGHPSLRDLLTEAAPGPGGEFRSRHPPRGAAVLVGHHRAAQGRDAHPHQPRGQRVPDQSAHGHRRR